MAAPKVRKQDSLTSWQRGLGLDFCEQSKARLSLESIIHSRTNSLLILYGITIFDFIFNYKNSNKKSYSAWFWPDSKSVITVKVGYSDCAAGLWQGHCLSQKNLKKTINWHLMFKIDVSLDKNINWHLMFKIDMYFTKFHFHSRISKTKLSTVNNNK